MEIAKARARIAAVLAVLALASMESPAQTVDGGALLAPTETALIRRQGLDNPALKLTDAQKTRIVGILRGYLAEEKALDQRYSAQDSRASTNAASGMKQARDRLVAAADQKNAASERKQTREKLAAAIDQVLNDSQRNTLKMAQDARPQPRGPAALPAAR